MSEEQSTDSQSTLEGEWPFGKQVPEATAEASADFRQGDIFGVHSIPVLTESGVKMIATPNGVAVISQTCDAVQWNKTVVAVAPVRIMSPDRRKQLNQGRQPRYVPAP